MSKRQLVIDVALCHNCSNCLIACKDEHVGNDYPGYAASQPLHGHLWFHVQQRERGQGPMVDTAYLPTSCNQCANAPCTKVGDGAVWQRDDGIVIIDPVKGKGKKEIVSSCPYGAIWWNEEEQLPQKWISDAHLLDRGWQEPRCAQVCPTGAIQAFVAPDEEMQLKAAAENLQVLSPEFDTAPRIYYRNLHRFTDHFVGGTVVGAVDGRTECLDGVAVELQKDGDIAGSAKTDAFGEFRIDKLPPEGGDYTLSLTREGFAFFQTRVSIEQSCYLGELELTL